MQKTIQAKHMQPSTYLILQTGEEEKYEQQNNKLTKTRVRRALVRVN